jgi:hypothetical protein
MSGSAEMEMEMEMQMDFGPSTSLPSTSPQVRPMGISPGATLAEPGEWYQGDRWPPLSRLQPSGKGKMQSVEGMGQIPSQPPAGAVAEWISPFERPSSAEKPAETAQQPGRQWSARFYAIAMLGEFVQVSITVDQRSRKWDNIDLNPADILAAGEAKTIAETIEGELQQLLKLMDYRPNVLAEALAQCEGIDDYFRGVLSFTQSSHPWTFGLMQIALRVGEFQAMHYKYKFNRPRASTLSPWLMPPIEVPRHASYPSGHSTQSHLVALILGEVMPDWARGTNAPLRLLAQRIARNREVMGLHYPSDTKAGEKLAKESFLLLRECGTVKTLITAARAEWGTKRETASRLEELGYGS